MSTMEIKDFLKLIYSSMSLDLQGKEKKILIDVTKFVQLLTTQEKEEAEQNASPAQAPLFPLAHTSASIEALVNETIAIANGRTKTEEVK